jgi:hypothetical protein
VENVYTNPWPEVVEEAVEQRILRDKKGLRKGEEQQCPMPIPYYLGGLNCGLPAYWYYMSLEDAVTVGRGCGQFGFQQGDISDPNIATLLCQQGEGATCTPGFGIPLFGGITNGRQGKSPCQELGTLINQTGASRALDGGCKPGFPRPPNMPPGFGWRHDYGNTYDQNGGDKQFNVVPNMAVDGTRLLVYEQFFQGLVKADMSLYLPATLDAEIITVTPGEIQTSALYCGAALNAQKSGVLEVVAINTSPFLSGLYRLTATCTTDLQDGNIVPSPAFSFTLGPGEIGNFSFELEATGSLVLADASCVVELTAGGGVVHPKDNVDAGLLAKAKVNCNLFLPTIIGYAYNDFIANPPPTKACNNLFCRIANAPWYLQYMIYIALAIIVIAILIISISSLVYAITTQQKLSAKGELWKRADDARLHEYDSE